MSRPPIGFGLGQHRSLVLLLLRTGSACFAVLDLELNVSELKGLGMLRSKAVFVNVAAHFFCTHWHSKIEVLQPFGRVGLVF